MKQIILHSQRAFGALMAVLVSALCARRASALTVFANIAEGTHTDTITRKLDATVTTRHLLYKVGSDADHIAVAGANDIPVGTLADEGVAEDYVAVDILGKGPTKRMVASEAMATTGVDVFAAASGKIALTGAVKVGTLLQTAAADGDVVEVRDCPPQTIRDTVTNYTADGAIALTPGIHTIAKTSAAAMTIAAPSGQDGLRLTIVANTDFAHVITFTGSTLLDGTTGANLTVTLTAFKGSAITVVAVGTKWLLENSSNVTSITA